MNKQTVGCLCVLVFLIIMCANTSFFEVQAQTGDEEGDFSDNLLPALVNNSFYSPSRDAMTDSALGADNSVYVVGNALFDFTAWINGIIIAKWDAMGNLVWSRIWYEGQYSLVWGMCLGNDGIYIVGEDHPANDIIVAKWSFDGDKLWNYTIDTGYSEKGFRIVVDTEENMYVYGYREGLIEEKWELHTFLMKVTPEGEIVWINVDYDYIALFEHTGLAFHPDGYILARNITHGIARWNLDGTPNPFQTPLNTTLASKLTIDHEGNIFTYDWSSDDPIIHKWSAEGEHIWETVIDSTISGLSGDSVEIESIAPGFAEEVFVLLKKETPYNETGRSLVRLNSDGEADWRRMILDSYWYMHNENVVHVGSNGLLYVSGLLYAGGRVVFTERGGQASVNRDIVMGVFDPGNTGQYLLYRALPATGFAGLGVIVLLVGYSLGRKQFETQS
ncbi:MAG: hypothetical protein EAX95_11020 [Candidatus Thorarchaeota archaeon]|nr:hypothetical protein [Candidatus Thorarchaeota archaeon]